jgi:hypothetical protein
MIRSWKGRLIQAVFNGESPKGFPRIWSRSPGVGYRRWTRPPAWKICERRPEIDCIA